VVALVFFVDVNEFRGTVQAQLERALGRSATLGVMRLKLFPLSINVADLVIEPAVELVRYEEGVWNVSTLGRGGQSGSAGHCCAFLVP
jgi:hypothetical protein